MPSTFGPGLRRFRMPRMLFGPTGAGVVATLYAQNFQSQGPEGELTAKWDVLAEGVPALVMPMEIEEVNDFGARDIAANSQVFVWRDAEGDLPQMGDDDRVAFTDTQGNAHTLVVQTVNDHAYAGVYLVLACWELLEG